MECHQNNTTVDYSTSSHLLRASVLRKQTRTYPSRFAKMLKALAVHIGVETRKQKAFTTFASLFHATPTTFLTFAFEAEILHGNLSTLALIPYRTIPFYQQECLFQDFLLPAETVYNLC